MPAVFQAQAGEPQNYYDIIKALHSGTCSQTPCALSYFLFFLNQNFYPIVYMKKYRGGHVCYIVCLGLYSMSLETAGADHGQH